MTFTIGETVVYPNHGAAVIEALETRTIKGEEKLYLVLRIVGQNDLVVRVPACNLDLVGVRDVVDADGLERVFTVLRAPHAEEPTNWSRRYKANLEKLHSGNVLKVAEVVRDLWRRERERGLSAEKFPERTCGGGNPCANVQPVPTGTFRGDEQPEPPEDHCH